jgi:hypothetical protein
MAKKRNYNADKKTRVVADRVDRTKKPTAEQTIRGIETSTWNKQNSGKIKYTDVQEERRYTPFYGVYARQPDPYSEVGRKFEKIGSPSNSYLGDGIGESADAYGPWGKNIWFNEYAEDERDMIYGGRTHAMPREFATPMQQLLGREMRFAYEKENEVSDIKSKRYKKEKIQDRKRSKKKR